MGSLAEYPDLVRSMFINQEESALGIYNVRFYIRGKPWVVTVDDRMLFWHDHVMVDQPDPQKLVFAQPSVDGKSIWGAILEKAWAKVKGNYVHSEAGLMVNGLRALTGLPVYEYMTAQLNERDGSLEEAWARIKEGEEKGYIMAITTAGDGDDS